MDSLKLKTELIGKTSRILQENLFKIMTNFLGQLLDKTPLNAIWR